MPIEKAPNTPLPANYVPSGGIPYRVTDRDDLGSIARSAGLDVWALIEFNFKTRNPAEINWYLRRNVGCKKSTHDNKNWMFSSDAHPGIIYLPPKGQPNPQPLPTPAAVAISSIKFWINAFIPRHIPNYTKTVSKGPHIGKTMIPGPQTVQVPTVTGWNPAAPFHPPRIGSTYVGISDGYLTDQRDFSNEIHAASRMHSEFKVDFTGPTPTLTQWHNCDWTTEVDYEDGDEECHEKGSTSRMSFSLVPNTGGIVKVKMECSASNPCAPTSRLFGDIDYNGVILIDRAARRLEFDGNIDQFPAFEAYATINEGAGATLFREAPPPGNTVMDLPGPANRVMRRKTEDNNGDGVFETAIAF